MRNMLFEEQLTKVYNLIHNITVTRDDVDRVAAAKSLIRDMLKEMKDDNGKRAGGRQASSGPSETGQAGNK